jgi:energy-converting hydrogenase Eha subunit C
MAIADRFAVGYTGPNDISGWLALLIFWFALQVIVYSLALIGLRHNIGIVFGESSMFAGFAAVTGYLLLVRNKKGVLLAKFYLLAYLILHLVALVQSVSVAKTGVLRQSLAICTIILWLLYLLRSKRVKRIYFRVFSPGFFGH